MLAVAPDKTGSMIEAFASAGEPAIVRIGRLGEGSSDPTAEGRGRIELGEHEANR